MIYRQLGRTGIDISLLSLGSGGQNPFGQNTGIPESEIHSLIHRALDLGINHFDTAARPAYGDSELILGRALKGIPRNTYTISSKFSVFDQESGEVISPRKAIQYVENSLRYLCVDELDLLLLGASSAGEDFKIAMSTLRPTFERLLQEGKLRHLGSSEKSSDDGKHLWLAEAVQDDLIDVVMVAYNMMNQSAEKSIFPTCRANNIGAMGIYTVRNIFSKPERLKEVIAELKQDGFLDAQISEIDPFGWLLDDVESSLISAAYRFSAANKSISTIVTGTINIPHLEANVKILEKPWLSQEKLTRLQELFGHLSIPIGN